MYTNVAKFKNLLKIKCDNIPQVWLIFGTEPGLIERSCEILIKFIKIRRLDIKNDLLSSDYNIEIIHIHDQNHEQMIYDEIFTFSLFPSLKILLIDYNDKYLSLICNIIEKSIPSHIYIILKGEDLKKSHKIRMLFESSNDLVSLHCYEQGEEYLYNYVLDYFRIKKINVDDTIIKTILTYYSGNIAILYNDLEKIALYCLNSESYIMQNSSTINSRNQDIFTESTRINTSLSINTRLSINANIIHEIMSDEKLFSLELIISAIINQDKKSIINEINKIHYQSISPIFIIRSIQFFLNRVINIQFMVQNGETITSSIQKMKIHIFGQSLDLLIDGVKKMKKQYCHDLLDKTTDAEIMIKSNLTSSNQLAAICIAFL